MKQQLDMNQELLDMEKKSISNLINKKTQMYYPELVDEIVCSFEIEWMERTCHERTWNFRLYPSNNLKLSTNKALILPGRKNKELRFNIKLSWVNEVSSS